MSSAEFVKEVIFGGTAGLCVGFLSKKFGAKFVSGITKFNRI